jgi:hypothetical protein
VLACIVVFNSCGPDDPQPAAAPSGETLVATQPTTPTSSPEAPATGTPSTTSVDIAGVYESIEFYPACGNETLQHDGVTWYPIVHTGYDPMDADLQARIDEVFAVNREDSPVAGAHGFARVVAPGPGDDIGTLVVWSDGVARWVSDSRELDVWMVDDEITYTWVC